MRPGHIPSIGVDVLKSWLMALGKNTNDIATNSLIFLDRLKCVFSFSITLGWSRTLSLTCILVNIFLRLRFCKNRHIPPLSTVFICLTSWLRRKTEENFHMAKILVQSLTRSINTLAQVSLQYFFSCVQKSNLAWSWWKSFPTDSTKPQMENSHFAQVTYFPS